MYEKKFPTLTSSQSKQLLSLTTGGDMEWMTLGHLDVQNFGSDGRTKQISYIQDSAITASRIYFESGETYPVLSDTETTVKVTSLKSGSETVTLDANTDTTVNLATINGDTILNNTNIELPTHDDVDASINNKIKKGSASNVAAIHIDDDNDTFEFTQTEVTIVNSIVYARAFSMSSDRDLKTDIREDCFSREMPDIHGFKWKDSSV